MPVDSTVTPGVARECSSRPWPAEDAAALHHRDAHTTQSFTGSSLKSIQKCLYWHDCK